MFYLFISRLHAISKNIHANIKLNNHRSTINGIKQKAQNDTILFNITAKLTVLACGPLIITQITFIFEVVLAILNGEYGSNNIIKNEQFLFSPITV